MFETLSLLKIHPLDPKIPSFKWLIFFCAIVFVVDEVVVVWQNLRHQRDRGTKSSRYKFHLGCEWRGCPSASTVSLAANVIFLLRAGGSSYQLGRKLNEGSNTMSNCRQNYLPEAHDYVLLVDLLMVFNVPSQQLYLGKL
jgi:hypothetical protein